MAAVAAGVAVRIVLAAAIPVFPIVANTWDSTFYHETATALSEGDGFSFQGRPTAFFPPGYSTVLAGAYAVAGSRPGAGQGVNLVGSLVLLAVVVSLVGGLAGGRAARWCAVLMALDPTQCTMPAFLMSETVCAAWIGGMLLFAVRWARGGGWGAVVGAGVCAACAGMTRGHAFLLLPAVFVAIAWVGSRPRGKALAAASVGVALCLLVIGAWSVRNARVLGEPVPVATNAGINLLLGNNENARGGRADPPGGVPQTGDEVVDERLARELAWTYIKANPGRTALMIPVKVARLWAFAPAATYRAELSAKLGKGVASALVGAAQIAHVVLLILAGLLVWSVHRRGPGGTRVSGGRSRGSPFADARFMVGIVLAVSLVWTLGHVPFLGGARYLFPIQPLLLAAASVRLAGVGGDQ